MVEVLSARNNTVLIDNGKEVENPIAFLKEMLKKENDKEGAMLLKALLQNISG